MENLINLIQGIYCFNIVINCFYYLKIINFFLEFIDLMNLNNLELNIKFQKILTKIEI